MAVFDGEIPRLASLARDDNKEALKNNGSTGIAVEPFGEKRENVAVLAGAVGIEPTSAVLETAILPLNYAPMIYRSFRASSANGKQYSTSFAKEIP